MYNNYPENCCLAEWVEEGETHPRRCVQTPGHPGPHRKGLRTWTDESEEDEVDGGPGVVVRTSDGTWKDNVVGQLRKEVEDLRERLSGVAK